MSNTRLDRIKKELRALCKDPLANCMAGPLDDNLTLWEGTLIGPDDSPYEGGVFKLEIRFPEKYPFEAPRVRFDPHLSLQHFQKRQHLLGHFEKGMVPRVDNGQTVVVDLVFADGRQPQRPVDARHCRHLPRRPGKARPNRQRVDDEIRRFRVRKQTRECWGS